MWSMGAPRKEGPAIKRRRVAATLRERREQAGMSLVEAAKKLEHDRSWLSRIENAEVKAHPTTVRLILGLYEVEEPAIEAVANVARETRERGWHQDYADAMPEWFSTFIGLERDASLIRTFEHLVPGWLQTEDYARALMYQAPMPPPAEEIERRVMLRMARRELLTKEDPPQIRVVLDEAALRRLVGGKQVMAHQIERALEVGAMPNVDIQVLPFEAGAHAGADGRFIYMDFPPLPQPYPETTRTSVVYLDTLTFARYLEKPNELALYGAAFERICSAALDTKRSAEFMRTIANGLIE
jgi:transcriptional regulator with XRE-family HTH domain